MVEKIDSLSLESGALIIALISGVLALPFSFIKKTFTKWLLVLIVPFFLVYSIYWTPVWFGGHLSGEYSSWEVLFIVPWYGAGVLASALVCFLVGKRRNYKAKLRKN